MELLVHLNKRIKSRPKIQLPVETLLVQYQDPAAASFVTVWSHTHMSFTTVNTPCDYPWDGSCFWFQGCIFPYYYIVRTSLSWLTVSVLAELYYHLHKDGISQAGGVQTVWACTYPTHSNGGQTSAPAGQVSLNFIVKKWNNVVFII